MGRTPYLRGQSNLSVAFESNMSPSLVETSMKFRYAFKNKVIVVVVVVFF